MNASTLPSGDHEVAPCTPVVSLSAAPLPSAACQKIPGEPSACPPQSPSRPGEIRRGPRAMEPTERVDTKILETLTELESARELSLGLRVDAFILLESGSGARLRIPGFGPTASASLSARLG